jgi:hypothetical protein
LSLIACVCRIEYTDGDRVKLFFTKLGIEAWIQLEALPPVLPVSRALSMEWKTNFKCLLRPRILMLSSMSVLNQES